MIFPKIEINPETGRAAEVHQWLCTNYPEVKRFVILMTRIMHGTIMDMKNIDST